MTTPRPPAPLPRHVRALLAEYRDAHELPEDARDRIWSVVGAEEAPAPAFDPVEHEGPMRPRRATAEGRRPRKRSSPVSAGEREAPQRGNVRWLGWGTAMLAAAAVLVLAWQLGGSLAERRQASRTPDAAVMQGGGGPTQGRASTGTEGRATAREADSSMEASAEPGSTAEPGIASDSSGSPAGSDSVVRRRRAPGSKPSPEPEPTSGSTLAAERELVARAWRALALGETTQALDAAAEHARRFPAGLLAPERAAIDTIARCRRGDADGTSRATSFHRAHPRSPLAERVDEACAARSKQSTTP